MGGRPSDLKKIPDMILELLLLLFDLIESTGEWPEALAWAGITLIPKGRGGRTSQPETNHGHSDYLSRMGQRENE